MTFLFSLLRIVRFVAGAIKLALMGAAIVSGRTRRYVL